MTVVRTSQRDWFPASLGREFAQRDISLKQIPIPFVEFRAGEVMTQAGIPKNIQGIAKETWNRLGPLVAQDFADAAWDSGIPRATTAAALSFHGLGVQTYPAWPSARLQKARDKVSLQRFGKK